MTAPTLRRFATTGRGGFAEIVRAASGHAPARLPAGEEPARAPTVAGAPMEFSAALLASEHWEVALSGAGRSIRWRGGDRSSSPPPLVDPFDALAPWRAPEPAALELSTRDLERLAKTGAIAIDGETGTYKLAFELEWPGAATGDGASTSAESSLAATFAYRVEDADGEVVGWIAVGPAMPRASFPLRVPKLERRPLALRIVRVDAATGDDLPWNSAALRRAWLAALGSQYWVARPMEGLSAGAVGVVERMARPLRGGKLEMELAWTLRPDSPNLGVELDWHRAGTEPWPALSLGASAAFERAGRLAADELSSIRSLAELGGVAPADGVQLVPRSNPQAQSPPRVVLLSDTPFDGVHEDLGERSLLPARGASRLALVVERPDLG